jgi:2-keto-4-pentenoate hydratase/2-oxohepta-3-ene-1,7-dioic acid hydratase in catechol pathway
MDEILLGPVEAKQAEADATAAWWKSSHEEDLIDAEREGICRAQVRNVVKFGGVYADHVETCGFKEAADGVREFCKVLRAAAEEVRG